ncbi:hypothetical protein V5O48_006128 [Marasmius crinis-equi]|uniref:Uncharacterized protein n=1 Tax=Marasmius crinis-equi TaxID=585013 RepID=A0ABR3FKE2_9AGAR
MYKLHSLIALLPFINLANAHVAAWSRGMYCLNGTKPGFDDKDHSVPVVPLYQLSKHDWWMQAITGCVNFPPPKGQFLELPANGEVKVELSTGRAGTTLGYGGRRLTRFAGPIHVPESQFGSDGKCIQNPNLHTPNETLAAGTTFAIAYKSDPFDVKPEELTVFTVRYHTPWYREVTYEVPDLPTCPKDGCVCAWGWVANGCGQPNMYMQPFKCMVTGTPGTRPVAPAKPAVYCEHNQQECTQGAKQMIYYNQLEGNNIEFDPAKGNPTYNERLGFKNGRQTDIFAERARSSPILPLPNGPLDTLLL